MQKILFVCTGNTCRSPMAQAMANKYFKDNLIDCTAKSAGLAAKIGTISPNAKMALKKCLDIDFNHDTEQISEELIEESDMIIGISRHHAENIQLLYTQCLKGKILISMPRDIYDPYGGTLEDYMKCLYDIKEGIEKLFFEMPQTRKPDISVELHKKEYAHDLFLIEKDCFSIPWREDEFERIVDNPFAVTYVAFCEDKIVGFIIIYYGCDEAQILNVAIAPLYRKMGIAEILIDKAIEFSKKNNIKKVMLEARVSNNAAISLYEKKGFVRIGTRKDYYGTPKEDAALYDLYL